MIDNSLASRYLQSLGSSCSKDKLLATELLILKTLDFKVNVLNPLSYVETFLEVLGKIFCHLIISLDYKPLLA